MHQPTVATCSVSQFCSEYDDYLHHLRGLSVSTRRLHRYVVRRFLTLQFPREISIGTSPVSTTLSTFSKQSLRGCPAVTPSECG
jgi:hypothetical protein